VSTEMGVSRGCWTQGVTVGLLIGECGCHCGKRAMTRLHLMPKRSLDNLASRRTGQHHLRNSPMNTSRIAGLGLVALMAITLAGCEAAEESAQKIQEKAEQAVLELAREAVSDTVQAFNKQVDEAQRAAEELLGRQEDQGAADTPAPNDETAPKLPGEGVET
jgi:hypothetical protein